ncbi:MAG: N-glycosylase/DNA lyase [Spirochaetes bacterium]|nr:N-glycosylase/DNA lyase [Spirochaetota bacterium]
MAARRERITELRTLYRELRPRIIAREQEFKRIFKTADNEALFTELAFCILTPQSRAHQCWKAVTELKNRGLVMNGSASAIARVLSGIHGVRFHHNKARYIVTTRSMLMRDGEPDIRQYINPEDVFGTRRTIVRLAKGIGIKEASHFLRNIGFGETLAIIDRHVLRNLIPLGVAVKLPNTITEKRYYALEQNIARFAQRIRIPLAHLDFVLWYKEAHDIFK